MPGVRAVILGLCGIPGYADAMDERLRPIERLQCSSQFQQVFDHGKCFYSPCLRVHSLPNGREMSRVGLVVSRRVGKAVIRNRVKRLLREVFRRQKSLLEEPLDVILIPQGKPREHAEYLDAFQRFAAKIRARASASRA
jgi:ribonuclease P protein component